MGRASTSSDREEQGNNKYYTVNLTLLLINNYIFQDKMGNTESKDCLYCGSSIISCSSSSNHNFCEACNMPTTTAAVCHDDNKSFSLTERSSLSDVIGYVHDY